MSKIKIVIASILKPIDDTRMFEKLGISIGQTNKYDVNIIGFYTKKIPRSSNIKFFPLYKFKRNSKKRFLAPWKYYKILLKVKPEIIIVNTPELLIVNIAYKILFGAKILYDVQENYHRNIIHTDTYPIILKYPLAVSVRWLEWLTRPFIHHYLLAEKNYENEFLFSKGKSTVIENKFRNVSGITKLKHKNNKYIRLIYTGTIAENYGIFETIELTKKLYEIDKRVRLIIIGYCAKTNILAKIKAIIQNETFITLIGGDALIPHNEIIIQISQADFGLVSYRKNKSTDHCMPTKIYEYMAMEIPIILQKNPYWTSYCSPYNACIPVDFDDIDPKDLIDQMCHRSFYDIKSVKGIHWESEEKKLLKLLENHI